MDSINETSDKDNLSNILKNLIKLSNQTEINLFSKKIELKSKQKILKECEKVKKKEIKNSSYVLANLAKLSNTANILEVKKIYKNLENKIIQIDDIIDYVSQFDDKKIKINIVDLNTNFTSAPDKNLSSSNSSDDFIEFYTNC